VTSDLFSPAPPHSWWTVDEVALGLSGGLALYYRLGPRQPIRDEKGRWVRDPLGRTALEAFGALPLGEMYDRLRSFEEEWRATDTATRAAIVEADPDQVTRQWLDGLGELVAFVKKFGPLGLDWSRTHAVENRDADRALGNAGRHRLWQVVFPTPGFAMPRVVQVTSATGSWADRIRRGDMVLPHDYLGLQPTGPIWHQRDDLGRVLKLVEVLAEAEPNPHDIRDAAGNLPGFGQYDVRDDGARDPVDLRWRHAMRYPRDIGERPWLPFEEHTTAVKWATAGRLMLAEFLSAQLAWTRIEAGLDGLGRVRTRWTPRSLMELIYLQLLEHVEERLNFGVAWCPNCGGPVLRTRRSELTQNRAHRGCAAVLRKRRERARKREHGTVEASS
jgi:hypothetical protein